jgi:hypothetical protein
MAGPNIPQQFSTSDDTIQGTIDGINGQFYFGVVLVRGKVFRNGIEQTINVDCTLGRTSLLFFPASVPQLGDIISIEGFVGV